MRFLISIIVVWLWCSLRTHAAPQAGDSTQVGLASDALVIQTTSGIVHGGINASAPSVRHWLGIPFAKQPYADLRFQRPQPLPANASSQHVDATSFGPNCPQYESTVPSVYNKIVREFFIWGESGDDCLTVSVWAPLNPVNDSLPVFIWIYGGGFTTGGSSVPYQNPQKWVDRTQAHIVVSLQYRLNFFGRPNGPNLTGDLGFWDTRMAMEWTRDNIANFGGDPDRMVLWGQSAGAFEVAAQSLSFLDDPIVYGYIEQSGYAYGSGLSGWTDTGNNNWTFIAEEFGCVYGDDANVTACLQKVPQADVEALVQFRVDTGKTPSFVFQSRGDNVTTWNNATEAYLTGHYSKAPKILAHALMDGASLSALPPWPYTSGPNATLELASTLGMRCGVVGEAKIRESLNLTSYRMVYSGNFSNISPYPWMGAYHSSELPLLFGTYGDYRGNGTAFEKATSEAMQDFYLAFALDPENGLEQAGWPKYSSGLIQVFGGEENGTQKAAFSEPKEILEDACIGFADD